MVKSVLNHENTIIIKNSKFICLLYQINTKEDVLFFLDEVKKKYPNATHYCYAYIIDNNKKESDDGEPSKTAGLPMLQVLEKNELNHVLCIVVRYFGKIKLGANGLVRAYTKSVVECLKNHITFLEKGYAVTITFSYDFLKKIDYLLKDTVIVQRKYDKLVNYQINVTENLLNKLQQIKGVTIQIHHALYLSRPSNN